MIDTRNERDIVGVVLLSGFAALFKIDPARVVIEIVTVVLVFSTGLVLTCLSCFFAYRSARAGVHIASHQIAATTHIIARNKDGANDAQIKRRRDAADKLKVTAKRDATWAVAAGLLSLLAFVVGAGLGGWTLMAQVGSP